MLLNNLTVGSIKILYEEAFATLDSNSIKTEGDEVQNRSDITRYCAVLFFVTSTFYFRTVYNNLLGQN